jgi:hypothetical protein
MEFVPNVVEGEQGRKQQTYMIYIYIYIHTYIHIKYVVAKLGSGARGIPGIHGARQSDVDSPFHTHRGSG